MFVKIVGRLTFTSILSHLLDLLLDRKELIVKFEYKGDSGKSVLEAVDSDYVLASYFFMTENLTVRRPSPSRKTEFG